MLCTKLRLSTFNSFTGNLPRIYCCFAHLNLLFFLYITGHPRSAYLKSRLVRLLFLAGTVLFSHNNSALVCFFSQFQPSEWSHLLYSFFSVVFSVNSASICVHIYCILLAHTPRLFRFWFINRWHQAEAQAKQWANILFSYVFLNTQLYSSSNNFSFSRLLAPLIFVPKRWVLYIV